MRAVLVANPKGGAGKTTSGDQSRRGFRESGEKGHPLRPRPPAIVAPLDGVSRSRDGAGHRLFCRQPDVLSLPQEADWTVLDAPAGLQGYKLNDCLRIVDRCWCRWCHRFSTWRQPKTSSTLSAMKCAAGAASVGIVAMRVDPRTKAAGMLEEFLKHFDIPIVGLPARHTKLYQRCRFRPDHFRSATRAPQARCRTMGRRSGVACKINAKIAR